MPFWKKKEKRAEEVSELEGMSGTALLEALIGSKVLTRSKVMEISAVNSCVTLIGNKIATLPIKLYEKADGEITEIADDERVKLLNGDTGDTMNATEMRREWVKDYFLGKGAYTYIERDVFGKVKSLRYVSSEQVCITNNAEPIFKSYEINVGGNQYYPHEFLKILRCNDGYGKGKSVVSENELLLSVAYNTMKFENTLVKKGGNKKGFLKSKSKLSTEAMEALKAAWRQLYSNDTDNDNVIVLNDGVDFAESSNTSVEMQLNENKQTNRQEICSIFGVPHEIVDGKASETTIKQWVTNCIIPLLNVIEAALDSDLLLESEKDSRYFAFDTNELTRGDFTSRMSGYEIALRNNIMEIDEVRAREDLKPRGFNFMKLGLQDVLLDLKTKTIYTPNTNQFRDLGLELNLDKRSEEKFLKNGTDSAIIDYRANPYHDSKGKFTFGKPKMSKSEKHFVSSSIMTNHPEYKDGSFHADEYGDYFYYFQVSEPGTYKFKAKLKICERNKNKINMIRGFFDD